MTEQVFALLISTAALALYFVYRFPIRIFPLAAASTGDVVTISDVPSKRALSGSLIRPTALLIGVISFAVSRANRTIDPTPIKIGSAAASVPGRVRHPDFSDWLPAATVMIEGRNPDEIFVCTHDVLTGSPDPGTVISPLATGPGTNGSSLPRIAASKASPDRFGNSRPRRIATRAEGSVKKVLR